MDEHDWRVCGKGGAYGHRARECSCPQRMTSGAGTQPQTYIYLICMYIYFFPHSFPIKTTWDEKNLINMSSN